MRYAMRTLLVGLLAGCSSYVLDPDGEAPEIVGHWVTAAPIRIDLELRADHTFTYIELMAGTRDTYLSRSGIYAVNASKNRIRMTTTGSVVGPIGSKPIAVLEEELLDLALTDDGALRVGGLEFEPYDAENDRDEVWGEH